MKSKKKAAARARSVSILLELPVPVVERADLPSLEPPGDAVEVEGVVAHAPRDGALLGGRRRLVGLALDAEVHDVVAADGAVVHHDVPGPKCHRVPLLHLESRRKVNGKDLMILHSVRM